MSVIDFIYSGDKYFGICHGDLIKACKGSLYELAKDTLMKGESLLTVIKEINTELEFNFSQDNIEYLPPFHSCNPNDMLILGAGQTHARSNQSIINTSVPEVFIRGNREVIKLSGENLIAPHGSVSCSEEAELVMIYLINKDGNPVRLGYSIGNDFSDFGLVGSTGDYRYLSRAKLINCSISPLVELSSCLPKTLYLHTKIIDHNSNIKYDKTIKTGSSAMLIPLKKIEKDIFSMPQFCIPGLICYVYLGCETSSHKHGVQIKNRDHIYIYDVEKKLIVENMVVAYDSALNNK